jgi:hypothetical protein
MRILNDNNRLRFGHNDDPAESVFKNGFDAGRILIPGEESEELQSLHADLVREFQPKSETEARLIGEMTNHKWLYYRAIRLQNECLASLGFGENPGPAFAAYLRYQMVNEHSYERALKQFLDQRKSKDNSDRPKRDPHKICLMWIGENGNWEPMPGFEDKFDEAKWLLTNPGVPYNLPERPCNPND